MEGIRRLLAERYGAPAAALSPLYEADQASAYRVSPDPGRLWVLRIFSPHRPVERVDGDARILAYLAEEGFPAERLVPTLDGRVSCDLDGRGVYVTGFVPGDPVGSTPRECRCLGSLLGRLVTLERLPPEARRPAGSLPREDLTYGRRCLAEVERLVPAERRSEWETLRSAVDRTDDGVDLPTALIHPDCQPGNAIRREQGRIELVDWTGAGTGPRVAALGVLLSGAVLAGSGPTQESDSALIDAVMDGFRRHVRLTAEEVDRLGDAIRYRPLVLAAREFAADVREGRPRSVGGRWAGYARADAVANRVRAGLRPPRS